uniref:Uncharacterized protein n=1 Tax=Cacopsylla melanoneura TaxID=428564 RepID=A0A8D8SM79_9HEMI
MIRHWFSHRCRFPGYVLVLGELFRDRLFQLFFQIGFGFRITSVFTVIILLTIILIIIRCFMFLFLLHCRRVAKFLHRHSVAKLSFHILVVVSLVFEVRFLFGILVVVVCGRCVTDSLVIFTHQFPVLGVLQTTLPFVTER